MIEHLQTAEIDVNNALHFSHVMHHISAYEVTPKRTQEVMALVHEALKKAATTREPQIVSDSGEMFLVITPAGFVQLCIAWKTYNIADQQSKWMLA